MLQNHALFSIRIVYSCCPFRQQLVRIHTAPNQFRPNRTHRVHYLAHDLNVQHHCRACRQFIRPLRHDACHNRRLRPGTLTKPLACNLRRRIRHDQHFCSKPFFSGSKILRVTGQNRPYRVCRNPAPARRFLQAPRLAVGFDDFCCQHRFLIFRPWPARFLPSLWFHLRHIPFSDSRPDRALGTAEGTPPHLAPRAVPFPGVTTPASGQL